MTKPTAGTASDGAHRAAVIDIGSNTIHLLVADCLPDRIHPVRDRRVHAGLGIAIADGEALGTDWIQRVASVVHAFATEAHQYQAREIIVLGTHAVRTAPDRGALTKTVEAEAGVALHVLSPEQEAVLCLAGAELGSLPQPPFLCADIGGGSCDLAAVDAAGVSSAASLPIGSGVLAARELDGDPPPATQVAQVAKALLDLFGTTALAGHSRFPEVVVTGGTARRLRQQVHGHRGGAAQPTTRLLETIQLLLQQPSTEWPHAVKPQRAALVRAGGMILQAIVARWHVPVWRISPYGLREGALAHRARGFSLDAPIAPDGPSHAGTSGRMPMEIFAPEKRLAPTEEQRYFSRELSMLQFHERVLDQTKPGAHPLLERVRFLSISDSNIDEFLSIHFSLLLGNVEVGDTRLTPDGNTQTEQLHRVRVALRRFMHEQRRIFHQELIPDLAAAGIHLPPYRDLIPTQQLELREWLLNEVFPVCTPLAVDPAHPFPFISNMSLNLGVVLWEAQRDISFARIKVPAVLPRLVRVKSAAMDGREATYVWLEDIMANNLDAFFPGVDVRDIFLFRLVRDAEMEVTELESGSLREMVQAGIRRRRFGEAVCLQVEREIPDVVAQELVARLDVNLEDVYVVGAPLGLKDLAQITDLDRPDLKDPLLLPRLPAALGSAKNLFASIRERDILLHHPYESWTPVFDFIAQAAVDPDVLAIKQTLYRIGRASPLVQSLLEAVDRGKQVAVVLELQARGDEESNIDWAQTLERAGAHVSFGVIGLKTHAKLSLIVRREPEGLRRYLHVGTGNYSATPYSDLSLFTCHPAIGADATALFNVLTGRSRQDHYADMLVSPVSLREAMNERIGREIESHRRHGGGHLIFKVNALVDLEMIDAIYEASRAGVRVDLIVRGMCCLRPGVPGMSETIRVISIVGRFLEHSRVYYFRNGGEEEVLLGSADLMERNLDRRVEVVVPVLDKRLIRALKERLLDLQLNDTVRAMELHADGIYRRVPGGDGPPLDSQRAWTAPDMTFMS